ncbi:unnamed protein product [Adineta ricciae]|uniref:Uncharacterized protein n=1 Tax=Adineta ricciae TaxID=249248 RepID=A0A814KG85_ADIRI|nr:unnamed protein product [Adineta ricciae]CAF1051207.1 unnamed protein product [Adineta ricciae]
MGGAIHRGTRFLRMYNIDNRVDRVLTKEKPAPAPRHPTEQQISQSSNAENNIVSEVVHQKNEQLLEHLHDVKVYSSGDNPVIRRVNDTSSHSSIPPLLNRVEEPVDENSADSAFGYVEPQRIHPGRVSLRQFLAYLQNHRDSPQEYSIERFTEMYTIKPEVAQQLFKYHSLLALQEVARQQSRSPARPPHIAAAEVFSIEAEARRKPGPETGISSKF